VREVKTVYMLRPLKRRVKSWIEENVEYEDYQMVGDAIAVEHRFIAPIIRAMMEEGFKPDRDFKVY